MGELTSAVWVAAHTQKHTCMFIDDIDADEQKFDELQSLVKWIQTDQIYPWYDYTRKDKNLWISGSTVLFAVLLIGQNIKNYNLKSG